MTDGVRRYHFVWIGRRFPYYCRLAIESVVCAEPAAQVTLHVLPPFPVSSDFTAIRNLPGAEVVRIDVDDLFAEAPGGAVPYRRLLARIPARSAAATSNLVRYAILHRHGGVYLDTDVIVLRPLPDPLAVGAYVGAERVWRHNERRVAEGVAPSMLPGVAGWGLAWATRRADSKLTGGRARLADRSRALDGFWMTTKANNAVIGAPPRSPFLATLLERALDTDPAVRYALGPTLVDRVARSAGGVTVLPSSRFYPVPPSESYRFFEDRTLRLPTDTDLIHYASSNHRALLAGVTAVDPRFGARPEAFWRLGREVRGRIAERRRLGTGEPGAGAGAERRRLAVVGRT